MEERDYMSYRVNQVIMRSLALLLDTMCAGIRKSHEGIAEPPFDERLRLAEANRLAEELNHMASLSPNDAIVPGNATGTEKTPSIANGSRIMHKIDTGILKVSPPLEEEGKGVISFGIGTIELTENDTTTDIINKDKDKDQCADTWPSVFSFDPPT